MKAFQTKAKKLHGTDFHEVRKKAFGLYQELKKRTKRKPYIRSAYFKKEKDLPLAVVYKPRAESLSHRLYYQYQ
ncbi:hypothetical protein HZA41_02865 [Candidatus Peregrinibacteria bacterium]|nr:hypothetical protein [Candidatus Peregrinibacteria bacterium]